MKTISYSINKFFNAINFGLSTEEDRKLIFLCDKFSAINSRSIQTLYRAIDISCNKEKIFRWLLQMKVAPYSYDLIDNLGRISPKELTPGLENVQLGQKFMFVFTLIDFIQDEEICLKLNTSRISRTLLGECLISYRIIGSPDDSKRKW